MTGEQWILSTWTSEKLLTLDILIDKLMTYGLDEQTVKWIENRMNGRAQKVVISGTKLSWKPVAS